MTKIAMLACIAAAASLAADEAQTALVLKAEKDYDRVALSAAPPLRDTAACIQSAAALVPVSAPEDLPLIRFRKGWCTLASAAITGQPAGFREAAAEFDLAIAAWPGRVATEARHKQPLEPVPPVLRMLSAVARLNAGETADDAGLGAALSAGDCSSVRMPAVACQRVFAIGREWRGWLALRRGDLDAAGRDFAGAGAWSAWVAGRHAFGAGRYADAAADYRKAVDAWDATRRADSRPLLDHIAPPADLGEAEADLGGAQLLAGDAAGAIAALDAAVKQAPNDARALYLRARAKEAAARTDAAMADYSLASRAAFANARELASGEGHLYRGILLYRRHEYDQAEDEFASALNFEIPAGLRGDAGAWRRLAAVAGGSCGASRDYLERSLAGVTPYFPKAEARTAIAACGAMTPR